MAKKKTSREPKVRQQRIPGSIDVPTENVIRKGEEYVEMLQSRMGAQLDENAFRSELIDLMNDAGLTEFSLDGHTVTLTHSETDKITVKKVSDNPDGD